jgi:ElaB/YqjD/DUF883 family membrane-anchored ribosome-binding protein
MTISTGAGHAMDAVKDCLSPALEKVDETIREGRRVMVRGQHAVEDAAAAAVLTIRRRPGSTVLVAAGVGALVGALVGFGLGRRSRPQDDVQA